MLSVRALAQDPGELLEEAEVETEPVLVVERDFLHTTLDNGLAVSIRSDPDMPIVSTQIWLSVGSAHEADKEQGFAHLFEHLMFGDTTTYDNEQYGRHHTRNGGYENAYTSFDNTVYISMIQPAAHDRVLVFEADRLQNLVLSQENLDNEKKIVTEELRLRGENNPISRLIDPLLSGIFGDHPYGHTPAGTKEQINGADLELTRKFYEGYYHPANAHLVITGAVHPATTLATVEELFGGLEGERLEPPDVPLLTEWEFPERVVLTEDLPPVKASALVYFTPPMSHPDYWAIQLMNKMIATGRVDYFREHLVKERKKAIDAGVESEYLAQGGINVMYSVSLPTRRDGRALSLLHQSRDHLGELGWLTEEGLTTARRGLMRSELERAYFASQQADAIGTAQAMQGNAALGLSTSEQIETVTLEQVQAAWETYIMNGKPLEVVLKRGKTQETEPELAQISEGGAQ
jgi:zinc protease